MIALKLINHNYAYEAMDIIKMFYGKEEIKVQDQTSGKKISSGDYRETIVNTLILHEEDTLTGLGKRMSIKTEIITPDAEVETMVIDLPLEALNNLKLRKRFVKISLYKILTKKFNKTYPWGILTGIRPLKIIHELIDKGYSDSQILENLQGHYLMAEERGIMALEIAKRERKFIYPIHREKVSVYIGIPFCPSRCFYCSFTSNAIHKCGPTVQRYLDALLEEIEQVSKFIRSNRLLVQAVYIGGGTPTSISDEQLDMLLYHINLNLGSHYEEFTCEAGRPDTITSEKLEILKKHHVTRLSINPQTMNNCTLEHIGRDHTAEQVIDSFNLARRKGFNNINMDIILGLPGEGMQEIKKTMEEIQKLDPESITVHTLALKRASIFHENTPMVKVSNDDEITMMMEYTKTLIKTMGMRPYYLYRQKHMLQNMENIGFCKDGYESIYNIQTIEDKQTIIALGADASTKVVFYDENRLERQYNIKDIKLYIRELDHQIEDKLTLLNGYVNPTE